MFTRNRDPSKLEKLMSAVTFAEANEHDTALELLGRKKEPISFRLRLEHWTNPLHLFCRFLCLLDIYDGIWHKLFNKKCPSFNWIVLLSVWTRFKNGNKASKKLLDHIYKGTKGE